MTYINCYQLVINPIHLFKRAHVRLWSCVFCLFLFCYCSGQSDTGKAKNKSKNRSEIFYGTASYYANKFVGKKTANGEVFSQKKLTAACNVLPLGTWVKVTNIRNNTSVVVKINDRLHKKNKRIIDLTRRGAEKIGYLEKGLTRVKLEIVEKN